MPLIRYNPKMPSETPHNLRSANFLRRELAKEGLKYGCVEVSLQALGADIHLTELLNGNPTEWASLLSYIQRKGFEPNWIINVPTGVTGTDFERLFEVGLLPDHPNPIGKMAGYLGLESYPGDRENHVIAILPRDLLPRDVRRDLKRLHSYVVVDANAGGSLIAPADGLAKYANQVHTDGGIFAVTQLWRVR